MRQGLAPEEARLAALRSFGVVDRTREAWRDARSILSLEALHRDFRHAVQALRRSPGFSLVVLSVLAVGIGAATSVFVLLHTVVLRPLPFVESDRLVAIRHPAPAVRVGDAGERFTDGSERAHSFEAFGVLGSLVALLESALAAGAFAIRHLPAGPSPNGRMEGLLSLRKGALAAFVPETQSAPVKL
jgi:hypothetical protein